ILWAEDRRETIGRPGSQMAAFNGAVRFHAPQAFRTGIRPRGWQEASAADGPSCALREYRTVLWNADRALRRGVSGMARASAGGGDADYGSPAGICPES